jgi:hypothetical protein
MIAAPQRRPIRAFLARHRATFVIVVVVALASSGTAAAVSYLVLGAINTAGATTTLKSGVNGAVLQLTNTNATGGTNARGLGISVPAGRAPMTVNSGVRVTNLNADKLDGIDSTGFIRRPVEAWHEVGTPGEPGFQTTCQPGGCVPAWVNYGYGAGYNTTGFYRDPLGIVHIKGVVRSVFATGAPCHAWDIFSLPAGYRPAAIQIAPTLHMDATARIDILTSGDVSVCVPQSWNANDWFSLDGISFRAAP